MDKNGLIQLKVCKEAKIVQSATPEAHMAMAIRVAASGRVWVREERPSRMREMAGRISRSISSARSPRRVAERSGKL